MKPQVLIVDDDETVRKLLRSRLEREGHDVLTAVDATDAEKNFASGNVGVVVTDLKMPGRDGFGLMASIRQKSAAVRFIVITGHGEKEAAVKALRQGASNYLEKPFDLDEFSGAVSAAIREFSALDERQEMVGRLEARVQRVEGRSEDQTWFVSKAHAMAPVNEWLTVLRRESMRGDAEEPCVLVLGASGTGKEGIARMIHAGSRRGKGPWIAVNCANFSEQLLESELFGHEKGAFTGAVSLKRGLFEIARGGTLFLDEIGEMDPKVQAKLLRVLQEKTFRRVGGNANIDADVRIIAATHQDLTARAKEGKFREDLYHRLARVVVQVPTLKDRSEDIVPMATQFAERAFQSRGKSFSGFSDDATAQLRSYGWPGNIRELLNVIERAALLSQGGTRVNANLLGIQASSARVSSDYSGPKLVVTPQLKPDDIGANSYTALKKRWSESFEREYLTATLARHGGNVSSASREARIDRSNFLRLLRRHGLQAQMFRKAA